MNSSGNSDDVLLKSVIGSPKKQVYDFLRKSSEQRTMQELNEAREKRLKKHAREFNENHSYMKAQNQERRSKASRMSICRNQEIEDRVCNHT